MSAPVAKANIIDLRDSAASSSDEPAVSATHTPRRLSLPKLPLHPVSFGILGGLLAVLAIGILVPSLPVKVVSPVAQAAPLSSPGNPAAAPVATKRPAKPTDRLIINRLGTNAPVISVGLTADGNIDTPKTLWQVAHYKGSPGIGTPGAAIIVGHSGAPGQIGVFEHIDRLEVGDLIVYRAIDGTTFTYRVASSAAYPVSAETARLLSAPTISPTLNLISCYGHWDKSTEQYDQRWIVKSELITQ